MPEGVAVLLGVVRVEVIDGVVSKLWGLERNGRSVVWVVDVMEPSWVGGMSVVTIGTVLLVEELMRAVLGMVEMSMVDEATAIGVPVSLTPKVVGLVEIISVE